MSGSCFVTVTALTGIICNCSSKSLLETYYQYYTYRTVDIEPLSIITFRKNKTGVTPSNM